MLSRDNLHRNIWGTERQADMMTRKQVQSQSNAQKGYRNYVTGDSLASGWYFFPYSDSKYWEKKENCCNRIHVSWEKIRGFGQFKKVTSQNRHSEQWHRKNY